MTNHDASATVLDFLSVFSQGAVDGVLAAMSDDGTWWVSGSVDGFSAEKTKSEMGGLLRGVTDIYVDGALKLTPTEVITEGDRVSSRPTATPS